MGFNSGFKGLKCVYTDIKHNNFGTRKNMLNSFYQTKQKRSNWHICWRFKGRCSTLR